MKCIVLCKSQTLIPPCMNNTTPHSIPELSKKKYQFKFVRSIILKMTHSNCNVYTTIFTWNWLHGWWKISCLTWKSKDKHISSLHIISIHDCTEPKTINHAYHDICCVSVCALLCIYTAPAWLKKRLRILLIGPLLLHIQIYEN